MAAHALLSASGSKIWLNCTPAARAQEAYPDTESKFSREGSFGHELAAALLATYLNGNDGADIELVHAVETGADAEEFLTPELREAVDGYVHRCIDLIEALRAEHPDAIVLLEQRLDYSDWVPEGFGTGDLVIVTGKTLYVVDLKLGKGVWVDAVDNSQMKLYAAGAYATYGLIYPFEEISVTIDQPRLDNLSSERFTREELQTWLEEYVKPRGQAAWNGEGPYVPGDHCTFCRARHDCKARAEAALEVVKDYSPDDDFKTLAPALSDDRIAEILPKLDMFIRWAKDLQDWALRKQVFGEKKWAGLKLVAGRSLRKITDQDALAAKLAEAGVDEALLFERKLLGITGLEKVVGKKKFAELSEGLVVKPPGKPKLTTLDDKRAEWVPENAADIDFGGFEDE